MKVKNNKLLFLCNLILTLVFPVQGEQPELIKVVGREQSWFLSFLCLLEEFDEDVK